MQFKKSSRFIFIGDSITDCNREYDAPLANANSFGDGYVNLINAFTTSLLPEKEYMIINKGISGNTVLDLKNRWQKDVLDLSPEVVSIMIGINDVWRHEDNAFKQIHLISPKEFEKEYSLLISKTLETTSHVILMSPFMMETNLEDRMRKRLLDYQFITQKIATNFDLTFVDVQALMDKFLEIQSSYILSSDRVHPSSFSGHLLIAKAWLDCVGFQWN